VAATANREIRVDRNLCMGSGQCVWYAPNTFDQDDETIAIVVNPAGDPAEKIQMAVDSCPTRALSIAADEANEQG
jgi:ferredoxin